MTERTYAYKCPCGATTQLPSASDNMIVCPLASGADDEEHDMALVVEIATTAPTRATRADGGTGLAVVGDMERTIAHLFRRAQSVDGSQLVDTETGMVVAESAGMSFHINEFLGEPEVDSVEIGDDGETRNMKVKPHQWPPTKESF